MKGEWNRELEASPFELTREDDTLPPDTSEMPPPLGILPCPVIEEPSGPPRDADLRDRLFAALPGGMISNAAREFYYGRRALNDKQLRAAFAVADASEKPGISYACKVYEACLGEMMNASTRKRDQEAPPQSRAELSPLGEIITGPLSEDEQQALIDGTKKALGGQGLERKQLTEEKVEMPADPGLIMLVSHGVPPDVALFISRRKEPDWIAPLVLAFTAEGMTGRQLGHAIRALCDPGPPAGPPPDPGGARFEPSGLLPSVSQAKRGEP